MTTPTQTTGPYGGLGPTTSVNTPVACSPGRFCAAMPIAWSVPWRAARAETAASPLLLTKVRPGAHRRLLADSPGGPPGDVKKHTDVSVKAYDSLSPERKRRREEPSSSRRAVKAVPAGLQLTCAAPGVVVFQQAFPQSTGREVLSPPGGVAPAVIVESRPVSAGRSPGVWPREGS